MSKKKVQYPIRKMGKLCGYEEYEDGSIEIAPSHYQKIDAIMAQEEAIAALLGHLTEACQKLMVPIKAAQRRFWIELADDYSLDSEKYTHYYDANTKKVRRELKNPLADEETPMDKEGEDA